MQVGDCVRIPDGRLGRLRQLDQQRCKVRVMRPSHTNQFLYFPAAQLQVVPPPKGWMSRDGYLRYLAVTLAKHEQRQAARRVSTVEIGHASTPTPGQQEV